MWLQQELLERYPHVKVELTLLGRCGKQLDGVLVGKLDSLSLLFPRDGVRAEDLYHDATGTRVVQQPGASEHPGGPDGTAARAGTCGYWRSGRALGARPAPCCRCCRPIEPSTTTPTCRPAFFDAAATRFSQYPFL